MYVQLYYVSNKTNKHLVVAILPSSQYTAGVSTGKEHCSNRALTDARTPCWVQCYIINQPLRTNRTVSTLLSAQLKGQCRCPSPDSSKASVGVAIQLGSQYNAELTLSQHWKRTLF